MKAHAGRMDAFLLLTHLAAAFGGSLVGRLVDVSTPDDNLTE